MFSDENLLITGNSNPGFAKRLAQHLNASLCDVEVSKFKNGETKVIINESVRKMNCFIIQSGCQSDQNTLNDNLFEIFIIIDALKRGSAESVTVIMPYYPYERQDRKDQSRAPISAAVVSNCLESLGADRVMVYDLHAGQIQGFFSNKVPVDHLYIEPFFINYIKEHILVNHNMDDLVIVAPDEGGVKRAVKISSILNCGVVNIFKERSKPGIVDNMTLMGDVNGKIGVIVDDMIDTGGTACKAAETLKAHGCEKVYMLATHAILSDPATDRLKDSMFDELIVTNTIHIPDEKKHHKLKILDVSWLAAQSIINQIKGDSLSKLFNDHHLYKIELI